MLGLLTAVCRSQKNAPLLNFAQDSFEVCLHLFTPEFFLASLVHLAVKYHCMYNNKSRQTDRHRRRAMLNVSGRQGARLSDESGFEKQQMKIGRSAVYMRITENHDV